MNSCEQEYLLWWIRPKGWTEFSIVLTQYFQQRNKHLLDIPSLECHKRRFIYSNHIIKPFIHVLWCSTTTNKRARNRLTTKSMEVAKCTAVSHALIVNFISDNFWNIKNWHCATRIALRLQQWKLLVTTHYKTNITKK